MSLSRGMVLVRTRVGSNEACIVSGPLQHPTMKGYWTVVAGYLDEPPTCGLFEIKSSDIPSIWRRATTEEAAKVRALFITHASGWGSNSHGWVATVIPSDEPIDTGQGTRTIK